MSETAHNLSNSFLAVRLLALHEFPAAADQGVGPFLVVQHAIDPEDPELEPHDYVLTRRGSWLRVEDYLRLPRDERGEWAGFPSAAEVITLLERLPGRPAVEPCPASAGANPPPSEASAHGDAIDSALLRAIRGDDPGSSAGPRATPLP